MSSQFKKSIPPLLTCPVDQLRMAVLVRRRRRAPPDPLLELPDAAQLLRASDLGDVIPTRLSASPASAPWPGRGAALSPASRASSTPSQATYLGHGVGGSMLSVISMPVREKPAQRQWRKCGGEGVGGVGRVGHPDHVRVSGSGGQNGGVGNDLKQIQSAPRERLEAHPIWPERRYRE